MKPTRLAIALLTLAGVSGCTRPSERASEEAPAGAAASELRPISAESLASYEIFEPQLLSEPDGALLMVWRQKSEAGFDLFSARFAEDGSLSEPARVNDEPGTVYAYPHDEMRPGLATGPGGLLAAVWTDERAQIRAAVGHAHGSTWEPSVRLDQDGVPAYRSFTAAGLDESGALHAVWIDSRFAPTAGAEEPADLFYARLADGLVTEVNLTDGQEASICGCCKPDLETGVDGSVRAVFRNTTDDGFRDVFTVSGSVDESFSPPERVGPAIWQLEGCPMSGPLGLGDQVLWRDAASGEWVLKRGRSGSDEAVPVFSAETGDWKMTASPRAVAGRRDLVLVPGQPSSRLLERQGDDWTTARDDLPPWATSAALLDGGLVVVGAVDGELELETFAAGRAPR